MNAVIDFIFLVLTLIFCVKVLLNLIVAYNFLRAEVGTSFTFMPFLLVDCFLVVLLTGFSVVVRTDYWQLGLWGTFKVSCGMVLISYIHFVVVMAIGGVLRNAEEKS